MDLARDALHTVGAWITEGAPDHVIPDDPMTAIAAMRLVGQELAVEGIPERNLATFVTTWMEPEARRVIDDNLHRTWAAVPEWESVRGVALRGFMKCSDGRLYHRVICEKALAAWNERKRFRR